MGFDDGRVVLDSPNLSYFAGQTIFGKLEFQQDKVKTFRGIYVEVKGYADVHWTTKHQRKVNNRTEHYVTHHNAHEEYFSTQQYLVGGPNGDYHLQPGQHEFPFQAHIPNHCPSSFEGKHGHIHYEIKVVVDRAFKTDQEKKFNITVTAPLDLNNDPLCKNPTVFEFDESYCCWCMSTGTVETLIKLPVSGFVPGQTIPIEVSCNNNSRTDIDKIKLILKKEVTFYAQGTKNDKEVIAEIKKGPITGNTARNWTVPMILPEMDGCNVESCRIIDVTYMFKVKVIPDGCHSSSSDKKPIIIGTIPLRGFEDNIPKLVPDPVSIQDSNAPPSFYMPQNYPITNQPIPSKNPYSDGTQPYPSSIPPHGGNPYPAGMSPYPANNPSYPNAFPPNQGVQSNPPPYSQGDQSNPPPYPQGPNAPYPISNPPYPAANSYPGAGPNLPYPVMNPSFPDPSSPGFKLEEKKQHSAVPSMPMPQMPNMPPEIFINSPSAPEPSTPGNNPELKPLMGQEHISPYNPAFMQNES